MRERIYCMAKKNIDIVRLVRFNKNAEIRDYRIKEDVLGYSLSDGGVDLSIASFCNCEGTKWKAI